MIPAPVARCALVIGDAVCVGRDEDREDARGRLQRALETTTAAADRAVSA
jgi:lysophospholipid acyltransferase (LPLAT)-like uncharacterized protein